MNIIWREPSLRIFIQFLVLILRNLEKKVFKNVKKLPVFLHKIKTKA